MTCCIFRPTLCITCKGIFATSSEIIFFARYAVAIVIDAATVIFSPELVEYPQEGA